MYDGCAVVSCLVVDEAERHARCQLARTLVELHITLRENACVAFGKEQTTASLMRCRVL